MDCIFCTIARSEDHKHKIVWSDEKHVAFLTIGPVQRGHTLVIPRRHHEYVFDMPVDEYQELLDASRKVANGMKKTFGSTRVMLGVEGFQIPHVHVHLIPVNKHGDAGNPTILSFSPEVMEETAHELRLGLENI